MISIKVKGYRAELVQVEQLPTGPLNYSTIQFNIDEHDTEWTGAKLTATVSMLTPKGARLTLPTPVDENGIAIIPEHCLAVKGSVLTAGLCGTWTVGDIEKRITTNMVTVCKLLPGAAGADLQEGLNNAVVDGKDVYDYIQAELGKFDDTLDELDGAISTETALREQLAEEVALKVTDVKDSDGVSLLDVNKAAHLPRIIKVIDIALGGKTGEEFYNLYLQGEKLLYTQNEIIGAVYNDSTGSAKFYYYAQANGSEGFCRVSVTAQGRQSQSLLIGDIHSHSNQSVLNKLSESGGALNYDGSPVGAVSDVVDSHGQSLVENGVATIPESDAPVQDVVDSEGNSLVENGVATIPETVVPVEDVVDSDGNSLVSNGVATIPSSGPSELVEDEHYDLAYSTTDILSMYESSVAMTYDCHPVFLVERYGSNGADIFYTADNSGQISVYRARYSSRTLLVAQTVLGVASESSFTAAEKTKLAGIEAGAEVNPTNISAFENDEGYITEVPVEDVQDAEGNSLVAEGIATLPEITSPVQSDWNEVDSSKLGFIKNKPQTELTAAEMVTVCSILNDFISVNDDILGVDSSTALAF